MSLSCWWRKRTRELLIGFDCDVCFFFSSRRRHTRSLCDWSSDVCSSDLAGRQRISGRDACTEWKAFAVRRTNLGNRGNGGGEHFAGRPYRAGSRCGGNGSSGKGHRLPAESLNRERPLWNFEHARAGEEPRPVSNPARGWPASTDRAASAHELKSAAPQGLSHQTIQEPF